MHSRRLLAAVSTGFLFTISAFAQAPATAPTFTKGFFQGLTMTPQTTLSTNGTSTATLRFTITNPNATAASDIAFTDTLPAGLVVATPNGEIGSCGAGTITAVAGSNTISLMGGTLNPTGDPNGFDMCSFVVNVSGVPGTPPGQVTNTTGSISATVNGGTVTGGTATANITLTAGNLQICKVAGAGVTVGTRFSFLVNGTITLSTQAGPAPGGACSPVTSVGDGPTTVAEVLTNGTVVTSVTAAPANLLVSSNLAGGSAVVTVNAGAMTTVTFVNGVTSPAPPPTNAGLCSGSAAAALFGPSTDSFQVRYASNLAFGDSVVNLTNTGASSTVALPTQNGNLCVNVYTFSPDEQLVSCCSCPVTPDGLASLSVRNDLISNTLTPGVPTGVVVKLLATDPTTHLPAAGLAAYGTTLHATPGAPLGTYSTTETNFMQSTLSAAELSRITSLCGFIQTNGSGFGICASCRLGGLGAVKQ